MLSLLPRKIEVSCQFLAVANLSPGKERLVPIGWKVAHTQRRYGRCGVQTISCLYRGSKYDVA
jgi:hypothetical protein